MNTLQAREHDGHTTHPIGWMDRMVDEWMRVFPSARAFGLDWTRSDDRIRVDEFREGDTEVIRAELPGIDPATDLEITVADGLLHINADCRHETRTPDRDFTLQETRCGRLTRTLPLPGGATEAGITATYKDGILVIRVPVRERPLRRQPLTIRVTTG